MTRPPLPPFTRATSIENARLEEGGWSARLPENVSLAHAEDSTWRIGAEFISGRPEIVACLTRM